MAEDLRILAQRALQQRVNVPPTTVSGPIPQPPPEQLIPQTSKAIEQISMPSVTAVGEQALPQARAGVSGQEQFVKQNFMGFPIDTEEESPAHVKFQTALREKDQDKLSYLNRYYREQNPLFYGAMQPARIGQTGDILIKVPDAQGGIKEIPLNEQGMTLSDFASVAAYAPEMAGSVLGMVLGRKLPTKLPGRFPKTTASLTGAGGAATTGAAKDVAVGAIDQPGQLPTLERLGEIGKTRAVGAGLDVLLDALTAGAGGTLKRVISPFAEPGAMSTVMAEPKAYFKQRFGYEFPETIGEKTGSPLVLRTEAVMERIPGATAEMKEARGAKREFLQKTEAAIAGLPPGATLADLPSEEQVAGRAIQEIRTRLQPIQESAELARVELVTKANAQVMKEVENAVGPIAEVYPERIGAGIRTKAVSFWDAFQGEAANKYGQLYDLPGGRDKILQAPSLAAKAKTFWDELPAVEKEVTQPVAGLVGPTGQPLMQTKIVKKTLGSVIPPSAKAVLDDLIETKGASTSLSDLIHFRTLLDEVRIKESAGLKEYQDTLLLKLRGIVTDGIKEAAASSPNPRMGELWEQINKWYAGERQKFEPVMVKRLFRSIDESGFVLDENIVKDIGPTAYTELKKFLGESSPEFLSLKKGIADAVLEDARPLSGNVLEGKALMQSLKDFYSSKKSIAEDVIGKKGGIRHQDLQRLGELLNDPNAILDANAFQRLMLSGDTTTRQMNDFVREQIRLTKEYRSKIVKDIGEGKLSAEMMNEPDFMDRFFGLLDVKGKEMDFILDRLSQAPEVKQQLQQKLVERFFYQAQRAAKDIDPARLGRGEMWRPAASGKLESLLGDESKRANLQKFLGNETYQDLVQLGRLLHTGEVTEQAFASAGGISGGMFVAGMIRDGPLKYGLEWFKQKIAAKMITSPILKRWAGNVVATRMPIDQMATLLMAANGPLAQSLVQELGPEQGQAALESARRSIQQYQERDLQMKAQRALE